MKRLLFFCSLACLITLILAPTLDAGRKKEKTGKIDEGVFTDNQYGFTMAVNDGWKVNVKNAGQPFRVVLSQKDFLIPTDYADAPNYTKTPRIVLYTDTSSMSIVSFVDSLLSEDYKSDQKKEILKEFEMLFEPDLIPQDKKRFTIGDEKAVSWKARAMYTKEVATSASSMGGKRVKGSYGGAIIGLKKGDVVLLVHVMCEWPYFDSIYAETLKFVESIIWPEAGS